MTTKNTINTATINDVVFCPIESVFSNDSTTFVYLKDGGSIRKKQVIVGQSNENEIIIKTGVKADDELYLNPPEKADKLELVKLSKEELKKYEEKPRMQNKPGKSQAESADSKNTATSKEGKSSAKPVKMVRK